MHRTQLVLEDWQYAALQSLSARTGKSISALVRDVLATTLRPRARVARKGLAGIEGIATVPGTFAADHDDVLYGRRSR